MGLKAETRKPLELKWTKVHASSYCSSVFNIENRALETKNTKTKDKIAASVLLSTLKDDLKRLFIKLISFFRVSVMNNRLLKRKIEKKIVSPVISNTIYLSKINR